MSSSVRRILFPLCAAASLLAQDPPPPENPAAPPVAAVPNPAALRIPTPDPQSYEKVITKEARSSKGIFTIHKIKDRYYYEIPKSELGREFLLNVRIAKTIVGVGYGGEETSDLVVRWGLNENQVHLRA